MDYTVGQIVYVIMQKDRDRHVVPMQIIEEISKKTIDGVKISYTAIFGSPERRETITLDSSTFSGQVFGDTESVRNFLMERAMNTVNSLVLSAEKRAAAWYTQPDLKRESMTVDSLDNSVVQLHDGTIARLKVQDSR